MRLVAVGRHYFATADNALRIPGGTAHTFSAGTRPAFLRVNADGTLIMNFSNGQVTEDVVAGEQLTVSPASIDAASTADITVYW